MIDMHIHTNKSDGTDSVEELLNKAEKLKLEYISITDHDTCNAYKELKNLNIRKQFSGEIISGIEIKCSYLKRTIEVLGYKINPDIINKWLQDFYKDKKREDLQIKYFNLLYEKCCNMNLKLTPKEYIQWNPKNDWASFTIYSDIKKYQENETKVPNDMWESFSSFSRKYCSNPEHILFIDKSLDYPSLEEAIQAVKNAGGLVFMPHLFIYKWVNDKYKFIENIIKNYEIDGIECFYTDFTNEETKYLIDLCHKNNLFISGGSDYHGKNKPKISLGKGYGNLNINKDIIQNWV